MTARSRRTMRSPLATIWRSFRSATNMISVVLSVIAAVAAILLMGTVIADVVSRQLGGGSLPGMIEVSESLLVLVTFLGMAQAERINVHVRANLLVDRLPPTGRLWVRAIAYAICLAIVGWWAIASIERAVASTMKGEFRDGLLDFPLYPARIVLAVGLVALALMVIVRLVEVVTRDRHDLVEPPVDLAGV